jgi:hypothetical protein
MKACILIALCLISTASFACSCASATLLEHFQHSDFVAKVKVLKVSEATSDGEFQDATIEVLELYKGNKITTIKIYARLRTDCNLIVPENSTWLVFAKTNQSGFLSFGLCSGSMHLDRKINSNDYPNLETNWINKINQQISVLQFFAANHINQPNEFDLRLNRQLRDSITDLFKGYEGEVRSNAVFQLTVEKNLSISKIEALKEFDNQQLSKELLKYLKGNIKISSQNNSGINKRTQLIVIYYFYPAEKEYRSFISERDL